MPEKIINKRFIELARKWRDRQLTEGESQELEQLYNSFDDSRLTVDSAETPAQLENRLYSTIVQRAAILARVPVRKSWQRIAVAASLLFIISTGTLYLFHYSSNQLGRVAKQGLAPGGNKATLTLANGEQIILAESAKGKLAEQQNSSIVKTAEGAISYVADKINQPEGREGADAATQNNTLSTPRGGEYTVTLSDGTKVTLNAASTLSYPAAFSGSTRTVELSGEAWFEVAHDKAHPFQVNTKGQRVEVLGTQFNINAYENESSTITTLVSGSLKVTNAAAHQSQLLKPGQQTVFGNDKLQLVEDADIERATAWKNGYFLFESEDIQSIMRKIARWYDAEIQFEGPQSTEKFNGSIRRYVNVDEVLKKLALTNKVHFSVVGRTITVRK